MIYLIAGKLKFSYPHYSTLDPFFAGVVGLSLYYVAIFAMPSTLLHRSFLPIWIGSIAVLTVLAALGLRMVRYNVPQAEVVGVYERVPAPFLKVVTVPNKLTLEEDGTMTLHGADGELVFAGNWTWDGKEGVVRVDDPRWDRQIRLRSTLTGPRLAMRISALSLAEDHPEHDEEVDLLRVKANSATVRN